MAFRWQALDQQNVGFGEPLQRGFQWRIIHADERAQKAVGKAASDHRADLRHLARRPEPVEPRHERLLQRRRDRLDTTLFAVL